MPLKTIKSGIQVFYSVLKTGVDGATQYLSQFRNATLRYNWKQKVVMDTLFSHAMNTILLHRMMKQQEVNPIQSLDRFRDRCTRQTNFADAAFKLAIDLLRESEVALQYPGIAAAYIAATARPAVRRNDDGFHPPKRYRRKFYNLPHATQRRLDQTHAHNMLFTRGTAKRCLLCGAKSSYECSRCQARLCRPRRNGQRGCWTRFHTEEDLDNPSS